MQDISRREKTVLLIVFAALVAVYTYWIHFRYPIAQGDSAFLAQMLDRMVQTGRPVSQVAEAINHLFVGFQPFILMSPAEEICRLELTGPGPGEFNYFRWHTYFNLYFYIPLFRLLGGALGMSLLTAISFLMVILGAYVLLRKNGIPILFSALVALVLVLHPVWSGGVLGQFYADRLFIGPAFVLCALLLTRQFESRWVIALSILLALTSERVGVVVGALLIGAVVLADYGKPREWWRRRSLVAVGLLCMAFSVITVRVFNEHPHYNDFARSLHPASFLINLTQNPDFAPNLLTFVAINLVAWGVPALGCWRGMLLGLGVMVPNLIGNLGGAEKTAFTTHYHSLYFPVLAAAICLSFVAVYKWYPRWASWVFVGWLATAGFAYNLDLNKYDFRFRDIASRSFSYPFKRFRDDRMMVRRQQEVAAYLDEFPGTMVSTSEAFMPLLSRHHSVAYYPLGIDDSDFVVIPKSSAPGFYEGAVTYLGDAALPRINECLSRRLQDAGYQVQKDFDAGVVLARRNGVQTLGEQAHGSAAKSGRAP
jgi:hypothetical protein